MSAAAPIATTRRCPLRTTGENRVLLETPAFRRLASEFVCVVCLSGIQLRRLVITAASHEVNRRARSGGDATVGPLLASRSGLRASQELRGFRRLPLLYASYTISAPCFVTHDEHSLCSPSHAVAPRVLSAKAQIRPTFHSALATVCSSRCGSIRSSRIPHASTSMEPSYFHGSVR